MRACTRSEDWYYQIIVGLITFFGGLLVLLPSRFAWYVCCKKGFDDGERADGVQDRRLLLSGCSRLRAAMISLISGHSSFSKLLVSVCEGEYTD